LSDRLLRSPYAELGAWAEFQEPAGPGAIDLALATPRFDRTPSASTKLPADRRGWPPAHGIPELRQAIAEKLRSEDRLTVDPAQEVLITQGASGAFSVVLDTFVNAGDRVVLFDPCSPLFRLGVQPRRARVRWVATWRENGRTRFRLDELARALRGARLVVLNSPCNPTGGVLAAEDLEQIAWWANRRDVLIYSDDSFGRYCYEGERVSIGSLPQARSRTLTAGTVTHEYALAAARVGWLVGPRDLIRPCGVTAVLQTPFVPTLCQQIALTALRHGEATFEPLRAEFDARRRYAFERLRSLGLQPDWPAGGCFLWFPVHWLGMSGRTFAERLRQRKRVMVTPGEFFGASGAGYVRLSYAAEDGRLREGLSRLAEFMSELVGSPHAEERVAA
jgi:aspartate/methionine/tyrosine aminotransferase